MPELPEVESVCRLMRRTLVAKSIVHAEVAPDDIVLGGAPPQAFVEALVGRTVTGIGRRGKTWWIELDRVPWVAGHLGMSGWIREVGADSRRLHAHGEAPLDDESGLPRFLKLLIQVQDAAIAFTDPRRLGRLWLCDSPNDDPRIAKLGPDAFDHLPTPKILASMLAKRKVAIKAVLLDQGFVSGLGNWLVDEVLYQSRINPKREALNLTGEEVARLHRTIQEVLGLAIEVDADFHQFPGTWMFHHRWGGGRGEGQIEGHAIVRETVGGRTTAWVPDLQK